MCLSIKALAVMMGATFTAAHQSPSWPSSELVHQQRGRNQTPGKQLASAGKEQVKESVFVILE